MTLQGVGEGGGAGNKSENFSIRQILLTKITADETSGACSTHEQRCK